MQEAIAALALQYGDIRSHGYRVEKFGKGWTLTHTEDGVDYDLLIADHGCVSPRKTDAILEAYKRISWG